MFTISKEFHFSASHQLLHLSPEHQCARLHGHNYVVEFVLAAEALDENGFVEDYGALGDVKHYIDTRLDHRHLNNVLGSSHATTAENLARHLFSMFHVKHPALVAVRVRETPKTCAEYRP